MAGHCPLCNSYIEAGMGHACSSRTIPCPTQPLIQPCPQCARFREKLDREKLAIALCGGEEVWAMLKENAREGYLNDCDALINYLTE